MVCPRESCPRAPNLSSPRTMGMATPSRWATGHTVAMGHRPHRACLENMDTPDYAQLRNTTPSALRRHHRSDRECFSRNYTAGTIFSFATAPATAPPQRQHLQLRSDCFPCD
ncbi:hypothetical protein KP509_18G033600 [Ceratopteris richardii]|uniref:Uncharacterized protein n=1 Tax=Ceratopteris richardii TaxID=49495 RepID=A0A8T2SQ66_CERRI|nr:hypothetical protein KP509_18G033600 [Ceratopteris richardii]